MLAQCRRLYTSADGGEGSAGVVGTSLTDGVSSDVLTTSTSDFEGGTTSMQYLLTCADTVELTDNNFSRLLISLCVEQNCRLCGFNMSTSESLYKGQ
jgi:hypothetical protein